MMKIINLETIDSTNKYLIDRHEELNNFTVVTANFQTAGKGRENRIWYSHKGENVLASFLVKSGELTSKFHLFSICTAVCILNVLQKIGVKNVSIKWPNDVYVGDKKICGILLQGQLPDYFVVGIGLNVNQNEFEGTYKTPPTSIILETKKQQNIEEIKNYIFVEIERMKNNLIEYISIAQKYDYLKDKKVNFENSIVEVVGIDDDCSLKIIKEGNIVKIRSGEICIVK